MEKEEDTTTTVKTEVDVVHVESSIYSGEEYKQREEQEKPIKKQRMLIRTPLCHKGRKKTSPCQRLFLLLSLNLTADTVQNRLSVTIHRVHALVNHFQGGRVG